MKGQGLNTFLEALGSACQADPFARKRLVAPSLRVGQSWLAALACAGRPVMNAQPCTLFGLAMDIALPELTRRSLAYLGGPRLETCVAAVFARLDPKEAYLSGLPPTAGLMRALAATVTDLRMAGLDSHALLEGALRPASKASEMRALLEGFERALNEGGLADRAEVFRLAAARLTSDPGAWPQGALALAPQDAQAAFLAMEKRFWRALPVAGRRILPVDPPRRDGARRVFRAVGEVNEVREALRTCLARRIPFDDVEILHTDAATYPSLIYEILLGLFPDKEGRVPATFEGGLPARLFRPGRLLAAWISWLSSGRPRRTVTRMLRAGLLKEPRQAPELERSFAGLGPAEGGGPAAELEAAATVLETHARCASALDTYCLHGLARRIREMAAAVAENGAPAGFDARAWLARLREELAVGGEGPRPGRIHVAHVAAGGHSGRGHTFVLGLDDGRFPGAGREDAVLLDAERERLSSELPTAGGRLASRADSLPLLLARARGEVTLGFCSLGLGDDRQCSPGRALVHACRILSGEREAGAAEMVKWIGPPVSFAPDAANKCLGADEAWLHLLAGRPVANPGEVVAAAFPHLGRGEHAARERASDRFTEFDGCVPEAGMDLDPTAKNGPVLSASRLEALGRCPLGYFLRHVLGLRPPDDGEPAFGEWIDPAQEGTLLHGVFRELLAAVGKVGRRPAFARDKDLLQSILARRVDELKVTMPPRNKLAFESQLRRIVRTAEIFLRDEEDLADLTRPLALEVAVGEAREGEGSLLDSDEPASLRLPDGRTVRVRGRIDRVDEDPSAPGRVFTVVDYKTGRGARFDEKDPFQGGRHVQNAIYVALAEERLRRVVAQDAKVGEFSYYFPNPVHAGARIRWKAGDLTGGPDVIAALVRMLREGTFPPSDDQRDTPEDLAAALGDSKATAADMARKLANPMNAALAPLCTLRGAPARGEAADDP
ncbi:MAG: PD-(D/E)XK nuclease family protein [Deltaproteobacteria bacterium]|nr:PD-(D/E)XK nuclease family protein [Deltaproteobacteria bacterium]